MRSRISLPAALGAILVAGAAHATTISVLPASMVTTAPFALGNFGNANTNGLVSTNSVLIANGVVSFGGGTASTPAGVYDGNVANIAASPLSSGDYLVAEPGNAATISFSAPQFQFQLLWGSTDTYNSLTFSLAGADVTTVTGAQIIASGGLSNQSNYVTIAGLGVFDKIVATSASPAFEFLPNVQVPEPGTLALVGLGLGGLAWMRRRNGRLLTK